MTTGFCPQCGSPRQGSLRFCATCGFDLAPVSVSPPKPVAAPPSPEPQSPKPWDPPPRDTDSSGVPIASIIALLIGAAGVAAFVWVVLLNGAGLGSPAESSTPEPTSAPRPTATPLPASGNGEITFGVDLDDATFSIITPKTTFAIGDEIAWRAELSEPAGATSLDLVIAKVGEGGTETVEYTVAVAISNPDFDLVGNKVDLSPLLDGAGRYVMRYFRDATQLAEGQFTIQ